MIDFIYNRSVPFETPYSDVIPDEKSKMIMELMATHQ